MLNAQAPVKINDRALLLDSGRLYVHVRGIHTHDYPGCSSLRDKHAMYSNMGACLTSCMYWIYYPNIGYITLIYVIEGERTDRRTATCRVCQQHHPSEGIIRCTECQQSFHRLDAMTPAVYENIDYWRCGDCGGYMDMDARVPAAADITKDQATMSHLQSGNFPEEANKKERNRIRKSPEL